MFSGTVHRISKPLRCLADGALPSCSRTRGMCPPTTTGRLSHAASATCLSPADPRRGCTLASALPLVVVGRCARLGGVDGWQNMNGYVCHAEGARCIIYPFSNLFCNQIFVQQVPRSRVHNLSQCPRLFLPPQLVLPFANVQRSFASVEYFLEPTLEPTFIISRPDTSVTASSHPYRVLWPP